MLNMKNKLAKRIMAFVLSGAMVISGLAPTGMTAYAAEASTEISTEAVEESFEETEQNESEVVSDKADEETPGEDSGADVKEEETTETAEEEETAKDAAPTSTVEETETMVVEDTAVEEVTKVEENKATSLKLVMNDLGTDLNIAEDAPAVALENDYTKNGFTVKKGAKTRGSGNREVDGVTIKQRIQLNGAGTTSSNSICFTADAAGTLTVYADSSNSSDKVLGLYDAAYTAIGDPASAEYPGKIIAAHKLNTLTYTISGAGTYYVGAVEGGIHIYQIEFNSEGGTTGPEESSTTEESSEEGPSIPDDEKHTVWVVGDSTVSAYDTLQGYYAKYGYGTQLQTYFDGYYVVNNIAASGRSSKSYLTESKAAYEKLTTQIKSGDVLIIGFGHNDEKHEVPRYTSPVGDYNTEGSFAKSLYDNYVKIALVKGAQPILCTPIVRRSKTDTLSDKDCHIVAGETITSGDNAGTYEGGNYAQAIIDLGAAVNVPVVDLTALTKALYEEIGAEGTLYMHQWTGKTSNTVDNTHLNIYGAKKVAHMLATEIDKWKAETSEWKDIDIAQHVKNLDKIPTKENDLVENPGFTSSDPGYKPPTTGSTLWENYGIFKGTAFGALGGTPNKTNYTFGKDDNNNMRIMVSNNKGKLSNDQNGIAMYYYQIPADSIFELSAKATVKAIDNGGQVGFGLMARDNIYIDKNDSSLVGDYVVAGTLGSGKANCFYNLGSILTKGSNSNDVAAPAVGDTYELSIVSNQEGRSCKFGNNEAVSGGFDFQLTAIDAEYQYIGMFVARNADIVFSDIKLKVDGEEVDIMGEVTPPEPSEPEGPSGDDDLSVEGDGGKVNVADGLLKGKKYGYKDVATFTVLQDMTFKTGVINSQQEWDSYAISVDGEDYPGCVQGDNGPGASHAVQTEEKAVIEIKAIQNSKITFILRQNDKPLYFVDTADAAYTAQDIALSGNTPGKRTFYMKGGHTYQFYAGGSKVMVAGISIAKSGADDEGWPFNDESKPEGPGDEGSSQPGTGEGDSSQPGTGEGDSSQPGSGDEGSSEQNPSTPGTGEEEPDTPPTKIPADDKIKTISISGSRIKIEAANLVANPKKAQYNVTVTYTYTDKDGVRYQQQLTEGLHYEVSFVGTSDGKTVGEQKINITGTGTSKNAVTDLGKFVNKKTVSYQLVDKKAAVKTNDISKVRTIALDKNAVKNLSYTGNYITPVPAITGIEEKNADGKANYQYVYKNNVNAGKASVTVIGQGDYYGAKVLSYTIKPTDLSKPTEELKLSASNVKEFAGSGKAYSVEEAFEYKGTPVVLHNLTLTYAGKKLRPQEDYTIAYKVNTQKGTGTATIKGINNFKGSIKIDYKMAINQDVATILGTLNTPENAVPAEYSSKGARLTEIKLSNGVTLKENADYKVKYGKECKTVTVGQKDLTVTITGAGAYKNAIAKDTPIAIEVIKGKYHIKDGTVVDAKKAADDAKLISAAKITDASGAKVKNVTLAERKADEPITSITVIPGDTENYEETTLSCRVAAKLGSVKQVVNIPDQAFDGVNSVTVTKQNIADALGIDAKNFRIVSYKNNHKLGSATVTVEGTGSYYGTKNLKFKIVPDKINPDDIAGGDEEETSVIEDPSVEESEGTTESGETTESSGTTESGGTDESSTEESSDTEGSSGEDPDKPTPPVETDGKLIDVWDFGVKNETDAKVYKNHVTSDLWDASEGLGDDGKYTKAGTVAFGDLEVAFASGDRVYKASGKTAGAGKKTTFEDYTAEGHYYCGGTGSSSRRYLTINNVSAGDKIYVYVAMNNASIMTSDEKLHFDYQGKDGEQKDERMVKDATKLSFMANYSGTYKIWTSADATLSDGKIGGKPNYCRVVRVPAVEVAGNIDKGALESLEGVTIKFVNNDTGVETLATIDGATYRTTLAGGYTYTAVLTGATGYGFTKETKNITVNDSDAASGKSWDLTVEKKQTYKCSGSITGFEEGYLADKTLVVKFKTENNTIVVNLNETLSFSDIDLEPDEEYTVILEGVNDYEVKSGSPFKNSGSEPKTANITVGLKDTQTVNGAFIDLDKNQLPENTVTALQFKNVDDEYMYDAQVSAAGYTVDLRDGAYIAVATAGDYATTTHVVVEDGAVSKDLLFVSNAAEEALPLVQDLYVGYPSGQTNNYDTINKALKAAKRMRGTESNESERITIHIAPGIYREQVIVNVPYVTFVNDTPEKEAKITWYYGIGYKYYSVDSRGYYDAERAYDKYRKNEGRTAEKPDVNNWGTTVQVEASDFKAIGIVFENSFNRYLTEEELEDGVEPIIPKDGTPKPVRDYSLDTKSKPATERAAAMYIESRGDRAEFYRCSFLSSQDTLGTGKSETHAYFKECFIEGNTDYICGDGDCVFDNCVLNFGGYSDKGSGGYITAAQDGAPNGYLFWGCTVTGSDGMFVDPGYFGRPWRQGAKVKFVNTKLDIATRIHGQGWTDMSGATAAAAKGFVEYNTTALDGKTIPYDDKNIRKSKIVDTNPINAEHPITAYFGEWEPVYYEAEAAGESTSIDGDVLIGTNGDPSSLLPNCTLWVTYSLTGADNNNDASIIEWYRCKDGSEELIVKQAASVSKDYVVKKEDVGYTIKAVVTPKTTGGKTGEAKNVTSNVINDGWYVPEGKNPELGEGVNIFLAGDSTVKDYSPRGMYSNGEDKGSWGEYLQSFFNEDEVKIVNYANGGRSSRSFINEGSLAKIEENISEGDYLFIQFGHNDCANGTNYLPDRYVQVGTPDENGIYPTTVGTKSSTDGLSDKLKEDYGAQYYAYNTGTFKWYLQQYIDVAEKKGAVPVLVTPVSRMYYDKQGNGTIRDHHDATDNTPDTVKSTGNAYVKAMVQLADENKKAGKNVILIDAFTLTKGMYEDAWKADSTASGTRCAIGEQIMAEDSGKDTGVDSTHCNKLGGFITAAYIADAIKTYKTDDNKSLNIASALKAPSKVMGKTLAGDIVFSVGADSKLTANDWMNNYAKADYWTTEGQKLIDVLLTN